MFYRSSQAECTMNLQPLNFIKNYWFPLMFMFELHYTVPVSHVVLKIMLSVSKMELTVQST